MQINAKRWLDIPAAIFLLLAFWFLSTRLTSTRWNENLSKLEYTVILGTIIGIIIGYSKFKHKISIFLCIAYSLVTIPWLLAATMSHNIKYLEKIVILYQRLYFALYELLHSQPVQDPILFLTFITVLLWILSMMASYQMVRTLKPWFPIIILCLILISIEYFHYYQPKVQWFSAISFFFIILFIGRLNFLSNKDRWLQNNIVFDSETGFELGRSLALFSIIVIIISWNVPGWLTSTQQSGLLHDKFDYQLNGLKTQFENFVFSLNNSQPFLVGIYQETLPLGTGSLLDDEIVFTVESNNQRYGNNLYYFRAQSYDYYNDGQWRTTVDKQMVFEPDNVSFNYPLWKGRQRIKLMISPQNPLTRVVYHPSLPLSINRSITAILELNPNKTADVAAILFSEPLRAGETYTVLSWISTPTISEMRLDTQNYSEWIQEKYLQLPDDLSDRMRELAKQITIHNTSTYDKTMTITKYLRQNYNYQDVIPISTDKSDPIDRFLFTDKVGFCNYFASAEILLLRSLGIPARLVVGYTESEFDDEKHQFIIRHKDSHAWVEVFFSNIGWVEFEPTPTRPLTEFPVGSLNYPDQIPSDDQLYRPDTNRPYDREIEEVTLPETSKTSLISSIFSGWSLIIIIISVIFLLIWRIFWYYPIKRDPIPIFIINKLRKHNINIPEWLSRLALYSDLSSIERSYANIVIFSHFFGIISNYNDTPSEYMVKLNNNFPNLLFPTRILINEYQKAIYSNHTPNLSDAQNAAREMRIKIFSFWLKKIFLSPHRK